MNAINAINIAPTFNANCKPSLAPFAAASITLLEFFSIETFTLPFVSDSEVSGIRIFAAL